MGPGKPRTHPLHSVRRTSNASAREPWGPSAWPGLVPDMRSWHLLGVEEHVLCVPVSYKLLDRGQDPTQHTLVSHLPYPHIAREFSRGISHKDAESPGVTHTSLYGPTQFNTRFGSQLASGALVA